MILVIEEAWFPPRVLIAYDSHELDHKAVNPLD